MSDYCLSSHKSRLRLDRLSALRLRPPRNLRVGTRAVRGPRIRHRVRHVRRVRLLTDGLSGACLLGRLPLGRLPLPGRLPAARVADARRLARRRAPRGVDRRGVRRTTGGARPASRAAPSSNPAPRARSGWNVAKHFFIAHCVHAPSCLHSEHVRLMRCAFTKLMSITAPRVSRPGTSFHTNTSGRQDAHETCACVPGVSHATSQCDGGSSAASARRAGGTARTSQPVAAFASPGAAPSAHPWHSHLPFGTRFSP